MSLLGENLRNTYKNKKVFYRHYITAAAHWKHWPTFLHTVTCSTVAGREEAGGRREEESALPMQHGGRSSGRKSTRALTLSFSATGWRTPDCGIFRIARSPFRKISLYA